MPMPYSFPAGQFGQYIIEDLEEKTGKPVITSNQALAWDALRLCGIETRIYGFGRLLSDY